MGYSMPSLSWSEQLYDPIKKLYLEIKHPRGKLSKNLNYRYNWDSLYQVWFDLNGSLTRWKLPILKIQQSQFIRNNRKISYETLIYFLIKL